MTEGSLSAPAEYSGAPASNPEPASSGASGTTSSERPAESPNTSTETRSPRGGESNGSPASRTSSEAPRTTTSDPSYGTATAPRPNGRMASPGEHKPHSSNARPPRGNGGSAQPEGTGYRATPGEHEPTVVGGVVYDKSKIDKLNGKPDERRRPPIGVRRRP